MNQFTIRTGWKRSLFLDKCCTLCTLKDNCSSSEWRTVFFLCHAIICLFALSSDVHYDFCINTMFGSSLSPVFCLIYIICVCLHIVLSNTYGVVFFFVLCTLCCPFLWIVHFWLPLRYCLMFLLEVVTGGSFQEDYSECIHYIPMNKSNTYTAAVTTKFWRCFTSPVIHFYIVGFTTRSSEHIQECKSNSYSSSCRDRYQPSTSLT